MVIYSVENSVLLDFFGFLFILVTWYDSFLNLVLLLVLNKSSLGDSYHGIFQVLSLTPIDVILIAYIFSFWRLI